MPALPQLDWQHYLAAWVLVMLRVSALAVFAPVFSSDAIPKAVKVTLVGTTSLLLAPVAASMTAAHAEIGFAAILGELAVGLVFGLTLLLLAEVALFAGQVVGLQFSFSLVNLLDPNTSIQTPIFGQLFSLLLTTGLVVSGLHRILLEALIRSFASVPVGTAIFKGKIAISLVTMGSGIFLAAIQLSAPVLAATMLVEIAIALVGRLSPSLPVMNITIPAKTFTGYVVLLGSLALWPRFFEMRFTALLDVAQRLVAQMATCGGAAIR
ncbi:flagellar biosynthetic protein FliR [Acidipila rosea]|uniref:Flagellar biosynthetic protein FliR n=1 Tax=Acidipila rosea TaxID=768535 RepID=A0A4R1LFL5_9BACT|nr:flagellar biosynthetic protein FliR [Acidipila rosea]MBW4027577.1 flagellar biosynthetic protein FliR [Acidobacteriota bacterium]TCK75479.1 flagellar biosynthetic protein FliR [Acidipila rosea]